MEITLCYIFSDSHKFNNLTNHWMSLLCHISPVKKIYIRHKSLLTKEGSLNMEIFEMMGQRLEISHWICYEMQTLCIQYNKIQLLFTNKEFLFPFLIQVVPVLQRYRGESEVIFDCFCFFGELHSDLNFSLPSSNNFLMSYSFTVPLHGPEMMEIVFRKLKMLLK